MSAVLLKYFLAFFSLLLLGGYHLYLWARIKRVPMSTTIGLAKCARQAWVASMMQERRDILAVQTLRNWVMTANFLASTAILVSMGLLSYLLTLDKRSVVIDKLNLFDDSSVEFFALKILALIFCFLSAFFSFSLTMRYYNHVALVINIPASAKSCVSSPEIVLGFLDRGALHYTLGMRAYYLSIPLSLWLFGALWMLIGSLGLIIVLYRLDST